MRGWARRAAGRRSAGLGALVVAALCASAGWSQSRIEGFPPGSGPALRAAWALGLEAPPEGFGALESGERAVRSVRGGLDGLLARAARPGVTRVELSWPLWTQLIEAAPAMGVAPLAEDRRGLEGLTGQGVLVGVIDTGIDWSHPDFAGPSGPRIAWLLDLSLAPREGAHPGVEHHGGALWSQAEINEAIAGMRQLPSLDLAGHGTHVAGIIGGAGGREAGADGVAPGVEFIVVRASRGTGLSLDEGDVLEGVRFVLERAEALGRPAVINLSLGGHGGPHDGTTAFERELATLTASRPGCALVAAAGNDGGRDIHASGPLGEVQRIPIQIDPYQRDSEATDFAVVDLWYEADGPPVEVALVAPDGRSTGLVQVGSTGADLDGLRGPLSLSHAPPTELQPGLSEVVALIQEPFDGPLAPGAYVLEVRGGRSGGRFDAWIARTGSFGARFTGSVEADGRLTIPGTVAALTVGSWTTRVSWQEPAGERYEVGLALGAVSFFSSPGPTRDGRPKPDVLAPGAMVASALSEVARPGQGVGSIFDLIQDQGLSPVTAQGRHAVFLGTSMATAMGSGAAALLLEQEPGRTGEEVADLLRASAGEVEPSARRWGPRQGFGAIDLQAAVALGAGRHGARVDATTSLVGVTRDVVPPGQTMTVLVSARDAAGAPLAPGWVPEVEVEGQRGAVEVGPATPYGQHLMAVGVDPLEARGRGRVRVTVDGVLLDVAPEVAFGVERQGLGQEPGRLGGGGGCVAARSPGGPLGGGGGLWLVVMVLFLGSGGVVHLRSLFRLW